MSDIMLDELLKESHRGEVTDPFEYVFGFSGTYFPFFSKYIQLEGVIQIWRIENFKAVPLPQTQYGTFYSGDSYIVLFTPEWKKMKPVIYYWIGRNSTQDERGKEFVRFYLNFN